MAAIEHAKPKKARVRAIDAVIAFAILIAWLALLAEAQLRHDHLTAHDVSAYLAARIYRFLGGFFL